MPRPSRPIPSEVEIVRQAVDNLGAHFDNIVVFVSRFDHTTEKTISLSIPYGNTHAILDQVGRWVAFQEDGDCGCEACAADEDGDDEADDDLMDEPDDDARGNK